jgi:sensor histidine kinase regulating citrate/malate metabolism
MDVERAPRSRAVNRSLLIAAPLSALLVASLGWNVWYFRLEQKRRMQAQAEERASKAAVALANEKAEQARVKRQLRDAKSAGRIQQLYEEINHLTRVGEESLPLGKSARSANAATDKSAKNTSVP